MNSEKNRNFDYRLCHEDVGFSQEDPLYSMAMVMYNNEMMIGSDQHVNPNVSTASAAVKLYQSSCSLNSMDDWDLSLIKPFKASDGHVEGPSKSILGSNNTKDSLAPEGVKHDPWLDESKEWELSPSELFEVSEGDFMDPIQATPRSEDMSWVSKDSFAPAGIKHDSYMDKTKAITGAGEAPWTSFSLMPLSSITSFPSSFNDTAPRDPGFEGSIPSESGKGDMMGTTSCLPYRDALWTTMYAELCRYRLAVGNCSVPSSFRGNPTLARWVKRQRYQCKLMWSGKPSTMTPGRVRLLEKIGFVWDAQQCLWLERLNELKEFRRIFGHCNVPSTYKGNSRLASWVKCQRRNYRLFMAGKESNMTVTRIVYLESVGFAWDPRLPVAASRKNSK